MPHAEMDWNKVRQQRARAALAWGTPGFPGRGDLRRGGTIHPN
jgi:hypothetical protein